MNTNNRLPKSWAVKNDGSQLFKDTVIKYLNESLKDADRYKGGVEYCYYGITKSGRVDYFLNENSFEEVLTLQEFISLTQPQEEFKKFSLLNESQPLVTLPYTIPEGARVAVLEPTLQQEQPDFEALAMKHCNNDTVLGDSIRLGYCCGAMEIHKTYVIPLQSKCSQLEKENEELRTKVEHYKLATERAQEVIQNMKKQLSFYADKN